HPRTRAPGGIQRPAQLRHRGRRARGQRLRVRPRRPVTGQRSTRSAPPTSDNGRMSEAAAANGAASAEAEEAGAAGASPSPLGAFPDASIVRGRLRHFGRPDAERAAAFEGGSAVVGPLLTSGVLLATGPDAASFLHGQLANHIQTLTPGQATRSLLLNHKGHAMAQAMVLSDAPDRFRLVSDDGARAST